MDYKQKPITIYDLDLNRLGILEDYEEAQYTRSFFSAGEFSITINKNLPSATLLTKNTVVIFGEDVRDSGIISSLVSSIDEDGKGSQYITASGFDLRAMFSRRVIKDLNAADAFYLSDKAETVIKSTILLQCGSSAPAARQFPNLVIATDQARGPTYTLSCKYTSVYEECATAALQSAIGWFVYPDLDAKTFIIDCELGTDRTTSQSVNPLCIFDPDLESARSLELDDNIDSYRNLVYVGGDGAGASRTVYTGYTGTEPTGWDRFELFDDASSVSTTAALQAEAAAQLEQYQKTFSIDGQGLIKSPYEYKSEYNVGDVITCRFNGNTVDVRITDVTEHWAFGEYEISQTLGKPIATAASQIGSLAGSATTSNATGEVGTNVSGMKNGVTTFDLSSADATMNAAQCIYNVVTLSGTLTTNRTMTIYLDTTKLYGRKVYTVVVSASGGYQITLTTGISGKSTVVIEASGITRSIQIYVDDVGNVSRSERRTTNIDGGSAASVYGTEQVIDGGSANG